MPITEKEIEYVSGLARIDLNSKDKEKYTRELSAVLDFIDQLKKVNTDNIQPLYQTTGLTSITRKDDNPIGVDQGDINSIINQAPESEGNFFKVKSVLSKK